MKFAQIYSILLCSLLAACGEDTTSSISSKNVSSSPLLKNKICNLTLENFGDSQEEQLQKHGDCDISSLWALEEGMTPEDAQKLMDLMAFEVGALGYNPELFSPETLKNNIIGFQESRNEPVTGRFTYAQFVDASAKIDASKNSFTLSLPSGGGDSKPEIFTSENYAVFSGTWIIEGENHATPYNNWSFECERLEGICRSTATSFYENGNFLMLDRFRNSTYEVTLWNADEIALEDSSATKDSCRKPTIYVYPNRKEVIEITRQIKKCDTLPDLERPRIAKLVSGRSVSDKLNESRQERAFEAYSSEYKARAKSLDE